MSLSLSGTTPTGCRNIASGAMGGIGGGGSGASGGGPEVSGGGGPSPDRGSSVFMARHRTRRERPPTHMLLMSTFRASAIRVQADVSEIAWLLRGWSHWLKAQAHVSRSRLVHAMRHSRE